MITLIVSGLLWAIAAVVAMIAARRADGTLTTGLRATADDLRRLLPRLAVGVIGAGFLARVLPADLVVTWLGPGSGLVGAAIGSVAGAVVPGGPVVGFALAAAALKAGAGLPQVVAFVTAWSLFTLNRVLVWEVPSMPVRFILLRLVVSLPLPFVAAALAAVTMPQGLAAR